MGPTKILACLWPLRCHENRTILLPKSAHMQDIITIDDLDVPNLVYEVLDRRPLFFPELRDTVTISDEVSVTVYYMSSGFDGYVLNETIAELIPGLLWRGTIAAVLHDTEMQYPIDISASMRSVVEGAVVLSLTSLRDKTDMSEVLYLPPKMPVMRHLRPLDPSLAASPDRAVPLEMQKRFITLPVVRDKTQASASSHVSRLGEILEHIVDFCDFRSVVTLKRTGPFFEKSVLANFRDRISRAISPYIPRSAVANFLKVLEDTQSVVVGRAATAVLYWDKDWRLPRRLCVSAPIQTKDFWLAYLKSRGFIFKSRTSDYPLCAGTTEYVSHEDWAFGSLLPLRLVFNERSSALGPVFCQPSTFDMNFLTGTSVVALYPNLMFNAQTLARNAWEVPVEYVLHMEKHGIEFCHSSAWFQGGPCGTRCPALRRNLRRCRMVLDWDLYKDFVPMDGGSKKRGFDDKMKAYSWQLSYACFNPDCSAFRDMSFDFDACGE